MAPRRTLNTTLYASAYATPPAREQLDRADVDLRRITHDKKLRKNPTVYRRCVGSLRALGYGWQWLEDVTGLTREQLNPPAGRVVPREHMLTMLRVAVHIGDRWATPEVTDQDEEEIAATQAEARADHFYPPAAYDEVYAYCPGAASLARSTSGAPDAKASAKIQALEHFVRHGGTAAHLADTYDLADRTITRALRDIGMQVLVKNGDEVTPAPGQRRLIDAVKRAAAELRQGDDAAEVWRHLVMAAETLQGEAQAEGMRKRRLVDNQAAALRGRQRRARARTQAASATAEEEAA